MKKVNLHLLTTMILLFTTPGFLKAQCDCSAYTDPFGFCNNQNSTVGTLGNSCGLATLPISGSTSTCQVGTSCTASSNFYYYTIVIPFSSLAPNGQSVGPVTGYACKITGGIIDSSFAYVANFSPSPVKQPVCSTANQNAVYLLTSNSYMTQLKLRVHWTTASLNNTLQVWFYSQKNQSTSTSNPPDYLTYYTYLINSTATSAPATPNVISVSSPVSSPCGWKLATNSQANAVNYSWNILSGLIRGNTNSPSYSALCNSGNPYYITPYIGPTVAPNQSVTMQVRAGNGCGNSSYYTASLQIPGPIGCFGKGVPYIADSVNIKGVPLGNDLDVYPNPATQKISINNFEGSINSVSLLSAQGTMVKQSNPTANGIVTFDVSHVPAGIYFVNIRLADGTVKSKKVVVVK